MTEDELIGWHHQLNGHKFEQTQRDNSEITESKLRIGKPGQWQPMVFQRVGPNLATEQQQYYFPVNLDRNFQPRT